ncbi:hypothetical protein ACROYT_G041426 [Oculina patagonica]
MLKMRLILAVCFCANFLALIVNCTQTPSGNAECSCNEMTICQGIKTLEKKLEDLTALVNKTAPPTPQPTPPGLASSCKELFDKNNSLKSQVFTLMFGSQKIPVYCHMGNFGCGDGGWTLAMKIDGNKRL